MIHDKGIGNSLKLLIKKSYLLICGLHNVSTHMKKIMLNSNELNYDFVRVVNFYLFLFIKNLTDKDDG